MRRKSILFVAVSLITTFLFVRCEKDETGDKNVEKGTLTIKLTDSPTDDMRVEGTFITIAGVKIDGEAVEDFEKQTFEISALRNGDTEELLSQEIAVKSYSEITLVLDASGDDAGNSPGNYVLTVDEMKHNLFEGESVQNEITVAKDFTIQNGSETALVVDFDLRKAVVRNGEGYKFVTAAELENAVRAVIEDESGDVAGQVENDFSPEDAQTYVFIYRKGEFDVNAESAGIGESNVMFANAVTSSRVGSDGTYTLSFLEEDEYEVHLASYEYENGNLLDYSGMLNARSVVEDIPLTDVEVSADSTVQLDIEVLSLL